MNSPCRKNGDRQNFEAKTPHFFKIILSETIKDRKLGIPKVFVRKYGEDLKDLVYLKVPSGAVWQVELKKCDGYVWLQKGWDEFVEYYSIEHGHFLVFRYEGNSQFHVIIFDPSGSEIEYPFNSTHAEEPNTDSTNNGMPCHLNQSTGKEFQLPQDKSKLLTRQENASWQITRRITRPKIPSAPESVSGFKSEYPFFAAVILPACLRQGYLNVPKKFVTGNISTRTRSVTATLQVADRFWHVKFLLRVLRNEHPSKFSAGWPAFVWYHNLHVGDVCVFELIKRKGFIFKVSIIR